MSATICSIVQVPGIAPSILQPKPKACWATVTTIMISWKDRASYTIENVMDRLGPQYRYMLDKDTGLDSSKVDEWLSAAGLIGEPPGSYSQTAIKNMIDKYGPLAVTIKPSSNLYMLHAKVITGMQNKDGINENGKCEVSDTDSTEIIFVDPATGQIEALPFSVFADEFERVASNQLFAQISHFSNTLIGPNFRGVDLIIEAPENTVGLKLTVTSFGKFGTFDLANHMGINTLPVILTSNSTDLASGITFVGSSSPNVTIKIIDLKLSWKDNLTQLIGTLEVTNSRGIIKGQIAVSI